MRFSRRRDAFATFTTFDIVFLRKTREKKKKSIAKATFATFTPFTTFAISIPLALSFMLFYQTNIDLGNILLIAVRSRPLKGFII